MKKKYTYYIGNFEWTEPGWLHNLINIALIILFAPVVGAILFLLFLIICVIVYGN